LLFDYFLDFLMIFLVLKHSFEQCPCRCNAVANDARTSDGRWGFFNKATQPAHENLFHFQRQSLKPNALKSAKNNNEDATKDHRRLKMIQYESKKQ